jgi:hypothetical protein
LQLNTVDTRLRARFSKTRRVADSTTTTDFGQPRYDINCRIAIDGNECNIWRAWQIGNRLKAFDASDAVSSWVNRPKLARETQLLTLLDNALSRARTKKSD